jgi:hypothetical protein
VRLARVLDAVREFFAERHFHARQNGARRACREQAGRLLSSTLLERRKLQFPMTTEDRIACRDRGQREADLTAGMVRNRLKRMSEATGC